MSRSRNIAKALAKLHARVARFDPGSGGGQGEGDSPQMIAAAMGQVGARGPGYQLALVLLALKWWPDGVHGSRRVVKRSKPEWEYVTAAGGTFAPKLANGSPLNADGAPLGPLYPKAVLTAVDEKGNKIPPPRAVLRSGRAITAECRPQTTSLQAAQHQLTDWLVRKARRGVWPLPVPLIERINARPGFWGTFVQAVLDEYCFPDRCAQCLGHGKALTVEGVGDRLKSKVIVCPKCEGRGLAERGVERRAQAVSMRRDDFQKHLQPAYVWLLNLVRHLEYTAARALNRALDDGSDGQDDG